jgi:LPS sulfotransferase NodH
MPWQTAKAYIKRLIRSVSAALPLPGPATKFAVICRGRTGSNLLLTLIRSHPRIFSWGEIVGEGTLQQPCLKREILSLGPAAYARRCFNRVAFESALGVKALYYQLEDEYGQRMGVSGLPEVMDFLKSQKDIKIIHLKRKNRLKTFLSIRVAELTSQYMTIEGASEKDGSISISLTPEECEQEFNLIGQWEKFYDAAFQEHERLNLYYDDLVAKRESECNRILDFLNVPRRPLTTPMQKQRKSRLSEAIENFDALKRHFAGTEWAWYFEE